MKTPYITQKGYQALLLELNQLWKIERPKVTQIVSDAAAQGDRSENGDYLYGKKRLREIDRRVRYLQKRLDQLQPVTQLPVAQEQVFFGARVWLEDEAGQSVCYRILGVDEFDREPEGISVDSPMARSLIGRSLDEEIKVRTPQGEQYWCITRIEYQL